MEGQHYQIQVTIPQLKILKSVQDRQQTSFFTSNVVDNSFISDASKPALITSLHASVMATIHSIIHQHYLHCVPVISAGFGTQCNYITLVYFNSKSRSIYNDNLHRITFSSLFWQQKTRAFNACSKITRDGIRVGE